MQGSDRRSVQAKQAAALKDAVDDGLGQVVIVEDASPRFQGLVGREDHGASTPVSLVDDVEEHVGGVGAVGEIAHFVDDQDGGVGVRGEGLRQLALPKRGRQVVNQRSGGGEVGIEAILNRAIGDGHRQVRLPAAGFARENQ